MLFLFLFVSQMSEAVKTGSSSNTLEAVPSTPAAHQASGNSPAAVGNVRTLQDVQRDIQKEREQLDQARKEFRAALSAYDAAEAAWDKDPNNEVLSKKLAKAEKVWDACRNLVDISDGDLKRLVAELARLQADADASSEQKSKFLFRVYFV